MRARLLASLTGLLALASSSAASAQPVCIPGQGCKIQVTPPPVQWSPPPVRWSPPPVQWSPPPVQWQSPQVQVDPAQVAWKLELERRARWEAYFKWRADVWARAQGSIDVQAQVEPYKFQARQTPDPLGNSSAGFTIPGNDYVSYPRFETGFLTFCYGAYSGSGGPMYFGYCPSLRFRFNARWGVALDPAFVSSAYDDRSFGMFGLRPGVEYSFARGRRGDTASHAYVVAGFDLWLPTTGGATTPTAFLGGHAGLGALLEIGHAGFGFETRALVRGGVGDNNDGFAREMSTFRVGFEVRAPVIALTFW